MEQFKQLPFNITLLKEIDEDDIRLYLENGQFKILSYNKNAVVHLENDLCDKLEIILSGQVVVDRLDESGGILTISEFFEDDILGGNLLFSRVPYYPMTITTKKATTILQIEKDVIFKHCRENGEFLRTFLEYISDHTKMLSFKLKQHVNRTIRERLMIYLQFESKKKKTNKIKLNMSKKELAERMGVQRTSLSRELAKMKKDCLIDFDTETITILSIDDKIK